MAARDRLIQIYLSALGAVQIHVASTAAGVVIGRGKRADAGGDVAYWCDPRAVDIIVDTARTRLSPGASVDEAERALLFAAEELGAKLRSDAEIKAAAGLAVDRIETEFNRALKAGELRELNARYKTYRLAQTAAGAGAMAYSSFLWNERVALVKKTAELVANSSAMNAKLQAAVEGRSLATPAIA